ncbi:MAG TPA: urease accessory protein UreD [Nitrospira sp.]|nr:urease accessory protein UreD [Nitrospira sp.]
MKARSPKRLAASKPAAATIVSSHREPSASSIAQVGRVGALTLEYVQQDGRTVFGRTSCRTPWHLLPPIYLDETGSAYTLLVNPSGGLVGGDRLSIDLSVGSDSHVLISTPSANRVYRSPAKPSVQAIRMHVGPRAVLEWLPEHAIPFAGSRLRQSIDVSLAPGATVLLWDAVASGRIAKGERWAFAELTNRIRITTSSGTTVAEQYAIGCKSRKQSLGMVQAWNYLASLFVITDSRDSEFWNSLESRVSDILATHYGGVLGGVSQPSASGLVVKLVAASAPVLTDAFNDVWAAARRALWDLPPAILRKY